MQIERHEVRFFHAVVEAGGFSRAAERLHVSQSAVSQAIANLEHKVGTRLLHRTTPPELTESGMRMLAYASAVLAQEADLLRDIEQIRSGALSTLSLAMSSAVNRYHGEALLVRFCRENPLTRLKLDVAPSQEIVHGVTDERWELGFGPLHRVMPGQLDVHRCFSEVRVLVMGAADPRRAAIERDPERALREVPLLTSYLDDPSRRPGEERLRHAFGAVWEVSHLDLRLALVGEGMGVTYIPDRMLADPLYASRLVPVQGVRFAGIERDVGLFHRRSRPLSAGALRFLHIARERWGF